VNHGGNDGQRPRRASLGIVLLTLACLALTVTLVPAVGTLRQPAPHTRPPSGAGGSTGNEGEVAGHPSGNTWLAYWGALRVFGRVTRTRLRSGLATDLLTGPAANWATPGTVITNLDTAVGSPYGPGDKVVALTFDDGPSPIYTAQLLHILVGDHVFASFEIIGENGARYPSLLRQEVAEGMVLVSHTWSHVDLTTLPASALPVQLDQTDRLLENFTGHPVRCLRPPGGLTDAAVLAALGQRGLAELYWDVDPSDYLKPPASVITQRVLSALHPGAIVILHDGGGDRSQTVAALPSIISGIRARGYQIVPVCEG